MAILAYWRPLDYKELKNYHALLAADLCCTESMLDMLKGTDNFANNVFGFDSFKKTVQHWNKYPVLKKKKKKTRKKRKGFIGRVTLRFNE